MNNTHKAEIEINISTKDKTTKQIDKEIKKTTQLIKNPEVKLKINFIK